jgi:D-ribose pyranase
MKKQGILNRELAGIFAKLGHTDQIVIADCGLPIPEGVTCIDLAYKLGEPSFLTILDVVLDDLVVEASVVAEEVKAHNNTVHNAILEKLAPSYVSHEKFKQLTKNAKVIIRTGETTPYANIILQSGVIF